MIKKYINYLLSSLLILGVLSFYSCDDYLSKNPDNRLELDSEDKIMYLLASAYPTSSYFFLTEMASDNTDENGSSGYSPYTLMQEQSYRWQDVTGEDIDTTYDIWRKFYYAIETASVAIEALDEMRVKGQITDETNAKGLEAEALLCKAYAHFVLVNLFSKTYGETSATDLGIPYVEKSEKDLEASYERGTVKEVYDKIKRDLEKALPNVGYIPARSSAAGDAGAGKYHWNKEAAYAFATRFYLYSKDYEKAIESANEALGDYPPLRNWAKDGENAFKTSLATNRYIDASQESNFLLISSESIWGRVHGPYSLALGMAMQSITMKEIAPDAALPMAPGGLRYSYAPIIGGAKVITHKMAEYFEYLDKMAGIGWTHIVQAVFTADETLLARAEAYALSGLPDGLDRATADLHTFLEAYCYSNSKIWTTSKEKLIENVREYKTNGNGYYNPTEMDKISFIKKINLENITEDQEDVLYAILNARRSLTVHEGLRWFDINRYKIEIYRRIIQDGIPVETDHLKLDDPRRVFQIPQQIVLAGIEPNPR